MGRIVYLNRAVASLKLMGLYPLDENKSNLYTFFYNMRSWIAIGIAFITGLMCVINFIFLPFDVVQNVPYILDIMVHCSCFVNLVLLRRARFHIRDLVENINGNFHFKTSNPMEEITMKGALKFDNILDTARKAIIFAPAIFYAVFLPFVSNSSKLPLSTWCPYDCYISRYFELTLIWHYMAQLNMGLSYCAITAYYPGICILFTKQFQILASDLENNFYSALVGCGISKKDVRSFIETLRVSDAQDDLKRSQAHAHIIATIESRRFCKLNTRHFNSCIDHHQLLLEYCRNINDNLGTPLLSNIGGYVFLIVFIHFSISSMDQQSEKLNYIIYIVNVVFLLFTYCVGGQMVTQSIADVFTALYEIPWYLCDKSFKSSFPFVQAACLKEKYIKAGGYFPLTNETFVRFMNTSFSYYTVLSTLTD